MQCFMILLVVLAIYLSPVRAIYQLKEVSKER
jgi:hypothetical protein